MLVVAVAILAATSACSSEPDTKKTTSQPQPISQAVPSDPLWLADDLPRLPPGVVRGVRDVSVIRAAYEFAARNPDVMHYVPCFCGCERSGHKDNHDCFVGLRDSNKRVIGWEPHGAVCEVCVDVAIQTLQMHKSGASLSAIRDAVEKKYQSHPGGHHTATPMPKRGGTSHD